MEFINPTLTVSNTDGGMYLVRLQHQPSAAETLDIALLVSKDKLSNATLPQVQAQLLDQALHLLQQMRHSLG